MPTFLFDKIVFGPVKSRRLGVSLGINLLPTNHKICSFDCIYCECGLNQKPHQKHNLPSPEDVKLHLEEMLAQMVYKNELPDVITFAGNGEPTLHPMFADIINDTLVLRDKYCPKARIAVLSNATKINNPKIFEALNKIDDNILKLDSGLESTIRLIDRPNGVFNLSELVDNLMKFNGNLIIQTLFLKGEVDGRQFDNSTDEDVAPWLQCLQKIKPKSVMIYTISRDTPIHTLQKVSLHTLQNIATKVKALGIDVQVSG